MPLPSFNYRDIVDLVKKGATIEAQEKIMQLRESALEIQEENLVLKEQIQQLKAAQAMTGKLVRVWNCYYLEEDKETKEKPFCLVCWDADKKLVSLIHTGPGGSSMRCNICVARAKD